MLSDPDMCAARPAWSRIAYPRYSSCRRQQGCELHSHASCKCAEVLSGSTTGPPCPEKVRKNMSPLSSEQAARLIEEATSVVFAAGVISEIALKPFVSAICRNNLASDSPQSSCLFAPVYWPGSTSLTPI